MSSNANTFFLAGSPKSSDRNIQIRNPYDGTVVGTAYLATKEDASRAIERARAGFEETKRLPSFRRAEVLSRIASAIADELDDFAQLIMSETGKPIAVARTEVERGISTFRIAAEEAKRIGGEMIPLDLNAASTERFGITRRFPLGIVLGISPFNFPLNLVAHKVAPAIASGNAFLLKPPPQAPLTSLRLGEIIAGTDYPKNAWSILPCDNDVAEAMVRDERINMLSFTGSPRVGWDLKTKAGKKKVILELGGNAGVIVDETADLDRAVSRNVVGSFVYAGQVCIKVQRIYIHESRYETYVQKFVAATKKLVVGDPAREETMIGPLIDQQAAERVSRWIDEAVTMGAVCRLGGSRKGTVIEPTILENVDTSSNVYCSEIFGPVVTMHRFREFPEAVDGINDSRFGLQAGVFSNNFKNILTAFAGIDVGAVIVNDNPTYRIDHMPYGGIKDSGFGREGVKYAIEAMTEQKLLVLAPPG